MSTAVKNPDSAHLLSRGVSAWNRFWFTPSDPTTLCLMRLLTGLVTFYTFFVYSFDLQDLLGANAWLDLPTRLEMVREGPVGNLSLGWESGYREADLPSDPILRGYYIEYKERFKMAPPLPHARNAQESRAYIVFREKWGADARTVYHKGHSVFSLWFHVTEPSEMALVQGITVFICFLFTIGLCTRLTTVLTWLAALSYIHRAPASLFGVDTMMVILLLYLSLAPCGAVLSVDRLLGRWWAKAGPGIINRWRSWLGKAALVYPAAKVSSEPAPSVSVTVATRLIQIHLCIIYLSAGLAKMQGQAWWTGHAVWYTMANYEFAPMQAGWYLAFMRILGENRLLFETFFTCAALFTLTFEIAYPFLIWRSWARPILLGMAFILHGFIGMFMSLRTFSLMMVVLNLAFIKPETVKRWLSVQRWFGEKSLAHAKQEEQERPLPPVDKGSRHVVAGSVKRKR